MSPDHSTSRLSVEFTWACSYEPRSIQISRDSAALFVGCKDGTITVVEGIAGLDFPGSKDELISSSLAPPSRSDEPKVRALVDLGQGWLLAGRQDGRLYLNRWRADDASGSRGTVGRLAKLGEDLHGKTDPVIYLEWLDERHIVVSFRNSGTWILDGSHLQSELAHLGERAGGNTDFIDDIRVGHPSPLSGVKALCCTAPLKKGKVDTQWLLASATGELWLARCRGGKISAKPYTKCWRPGESPGWVNDYALVKRPHPDATRSDDFSYAGETGRWVYLATDIGVYVADLFGDKGSRDLRRVSLPGFGGMCIALVHCADKDCDYLWVSDTTGVHLFWSRRKDDEEPYWRRLGIHHEETPVMLAVGSWRTLGGGFVVGQARRTDRIMVSVYLSDDGLLQVPDSLLKTRHRFRQILAHKNLERLRNECGSRETENSSPESDLADFFEEAGKESEGVQALIEELSNPTTQLALEILKTSDKPDRAIAPWTHALLGTIHRRGERRLDVQCLAVIRWLRALSDAYAPPFPPSREARRKEEVRTEIEENIRFVRKWGLFGKTFAPDGSTWKQRWALRSEVGRRDSPRSSKSLDRLVYESQFFDRGVDLEIEESSCAAMGRTAWDIRTLETTAGRYLIAVSWASGGIRVHCYRPLRIRKPQEHTAEEPEIIEPEICCTARLPPEGNRALAGWNAGWNEGHRDRLDDGRDDPYGHSRKILLGKLADGSVFLLAAPTREAGPEKIQIWRLDQDGRLLACTGDTTRTSKFNYYEIEIDDSVGAAAEGERESVYTMLQLEEGALVLLGLRGVGGTPKILLVKILLVKTDKGLAIRLRLYRPDQPLMVNFPEAKAQARNRVWSMTRDHNASTETCERHVAFVGCEDGQVLRLDLPSSSSLAGGDTFDLNPNKYQRRVGRLGVPVWSLACRRTGDDGTFRVFAGGVDGTIVGWQEMNPCEGLKSSEEAPYTPLWATIEQNLPITQLHTLAYPAELDPRPPTKLNPSASEVNPSTPAEQDSSAPDSPHLEDESPLVLAVAQNGRVVFFDDRRTSHRPEDGDTKHHRLPVTGVRYGRPTLGATSFASSVICEDSGIRLVSATSDGRIRIYSFDYLLHRERRSIQHGELVLDWKREVAAAGTGPSTGIDTRRLRLVEGTFAASPALSRILVRWLLGGGSPDPEYGAWLPHHLRPLLDLARDLNERASGIPSEKGVKDLEIALERTCQLRDENLFVEILAVVLRMTNEALFDPERSPLVDATDYGYLLDTVERTIQHWIGNSEQVERIRIMFAKHMIDGDVLWHMACRAASQKCDGDGKPGNDHVFSEILRQRVRSIRYLLVTGQLLLALETLRASNLALARACLRLQGSREKKEGWRLECELNWVGMETFFKALTDFASRAAHSKRGINDVLKLEIVRCYALGLCACPSAAIRIAQWMSEANLILAHDSYEEFSSMVQAQCDLLNSIGISVPLYARDLFRRATSTSFERSLNLDQEQWGDFPEAISTDTWDEIRDLLTARKGSSPRDRLLEIVGLLEPCIGRYNAQATAGMTIFNRILDWLYGLIERFTGDAKDIDLSPAQALAKELKDGWEPPGGATEIAEMWKHSRDFWRASLEGFIERIFAGRKPPKPTGAVRPDIVLLSRDIASWCRDSLHKLKETFDNLRIFHPQYDLYIHALQRLRQAAGQFPRSAAVQNNLVLGVLDHGLLESLDEHVLELAEIAQSLDPIMAKQYHRRERRPSKDQHLSDIEEDALPAAERFARYLLRRSTDAEGIPKNLRTLHSILVFKSSTEISADENGGGDIRSLLEEFSDADSQWRPDGRRLNFSLPLTGRECRFLMLTLTELAHNDLTHGLAHGEKGPSGRRYFPRYRMPGGGLVMLHFEYNARDSSGELEDRIAALKESKLQVLVDPRKNRSVASNGMGLYLANLAAAVVDWELEIDDVSGMGQLDFRLIKSRRDDDE